MKAEDYLVEKKPHRVWPDDPTAFQEVYRFPNGYGASVVYGPCLFGSNPDEREIAVIKFNGTGNDDWDIIYDTPITDNVLGHISVGEQLEHLLGQIAELKGE